MEIGNLSHLASKDIKQFSCIAQVPQLSNCWQYILIVFAAILATLSSIIFILLLGSASKPASVASVEAWAYVHSM